MPIKISEGGEPHISSFPFPNVYVNSFFFQNYQHDK